MKKIVYIILCFLLIFTITGCNSKQTSDNKTTNKTTTYKIVGKEVGDYGKVITLNKNSDMPTTKYVYKIPAGDYIVTTTYENLSEFWIIKDTTTNTGTDDYPEELDYVKSYDITNGDNDFGGRAKKEIELSINDDESILINGTEELIFKSK